MDNERVIVNVSDAFLTRFVSQFTAHYGDNSEFVRAAADSYTLALAAMLEDTGRLNDPGSVARVSDEEAVSGLRELMALVPELKKSLFQEALGSAPVGSSGELVDSRLGPGVFRRWVSAFELRNHSACSQILNMSSRTDR
jgi:hypothetical protein